MSSNSGLFFLKDNTEKGSTKEVQRKRGEGGEGGVRTLLEFFLWTLILKSNPQIDLILLNMSHLYERVCVRVCEGERKRVVLL